jgi:hypothetical protein
MQREEIRRQNVRAEERRQEDQLARNLRLAKRQLDQMRNEEGGRVVDLQEEPIRQPLARQLTPPRYQPMVLPAAPVLPRRQPPARPPTSPDPSLPSTKTKRSPVLARRAAPGRPPGGTTTGTSRGATGGTRGQRNQDGSPSFARKSQKMARTP